LDKQKKRTLITIAVTAAISILATATFKDAIYIARKGNIMNKLSAVANTLDKYYLYELDDEKLADYAALGMTVSLDEPYTRYYSKNEFSQYMGNIQSSFVGIGIVISVDRENNLVTVVSPYEDSPGERAGILAGDVILAVDGAEVTAENITEVASKMRGDNIDDPIGTSVTLKIRRDNGEPFDVALTREKVVRKSVKSKMMDDGVAYLRITSFDSKGENGEQDTSDEFNEHLNTLRDGGMTKLILDLRGNPGGDLEVVCKIADKLLPFGTITYIEDKNGNRRSQTSDEAALGIPIVVLVNGSSASASEVLTGALKDYKAATVVGTKTYGKGIVQTVIPLTDGSGMSVTSARYFTPNGVCIHGVGIEPDIKIDMPDALKNLPVSQLDEAQDVQLKKALEIIKTMD
jgi:carboxyl-terminal processing protease